MAPLDGAEMSGTPRDEQGRALLYVVSRAELARLGVYIAGLQGALRAALGCIGGDAK